MNMIILSLHHHHCRLGFYHMISHVWLITSCLPPGADQAQNGRTVRKNRHIDDEVRSSSLVDNYKSGSKVKSYLVNWGGELRHNISLNGRAKFWLQINTYTSRL